MSVLHHDFQTNLNEWKEYAELVQGDYTKSTGLMLAISNNTLICVIILRIIGFIIH
jgi:hypothetical protein